MKVIDLTLPIFTGMPVYPGDPEVVIEDIKILEKDDWNMKRLHLNSHDGTHVNVPLHAVEGGKSLDDYDLTDFMGTAHLYRGPEDIKSGQGIIFHDINIDTKIAEIIKTQKPQFVGLSNEFEFDIKIERDLLKHGIISFKNLANTDQLPASFMFHGVPLPIKGGDGSLVRAYGVVGDFYDMIYNEPYE